MRLRTLLPHSGHREYYPYIVDHHARALRAQRHQQALRLAGCWQPPGKILDVGCGAGLLLSALRPPRAQGVGCDIYADAFLATIPRPEDIGFVQADGIQLPFADAAFDLVLMLAVIGEFPDWRAALQEMSRCVAPGGLLYITVTNARLLLPLYKLAEQAGYQVRQACWDYARLSLRLADGRPEEGFCVPGLAGWRYIHLTPHLLRSQWSWCRWLPLGCLDHLTRRFAPSFGFAWQRPLHNTKRNEM
ncbi:MAG: class I SAM-dependent methyltransferase [Candidatus Tectimicrobiota bacterium]